MISMRATVTGVVVEKGMRQSGGKNYPRVWVRQEGSSARFGADEVEVSQEIYDAVKVDDEVALVCTIRARGSRDGGRPFLSVWSDNIAPASLRAVV